VRGAVEKICARFDGDYWLERDSDGKFPEEFYRALADTAGSASAFRKPMAVRASASPKRP
jgi:hypothetical protein